MYRYIIARDFAHRVTRIMVGRNTSTLQPPYCIHVPELRMSTSYIIYIRLI